MADKFDTNDRKSTSSDASIRTMRRIFALATLLIGIAVGYFIYTTSVAPGSQYPFKLGLDLAGGSHLVYEADVSGVPEGEVSDAMQTLREVIERRVNVFGVSEPIVQVEQSSIVAEGAPAQRLIVELPGVTDIDEAIAAIGETPLLEFKLARTEGSVATTSKDANTDTAAVSLSRTYEDTGLTGRFLDRATLEFGQGSSGLSNEPVVLVTFNSEGATRFETITREHVGEQLAIFLDGDLVSEPVIREPIAGGTAVISGNFDPEEARDLVRNLNFGALPVPIELQSTQVIGASLGAEVLDKGVAAGVIGFALVIAFMVLWYRVPGVVAVLALSFYVLLMLALFKLIPVVLTAAGLAGFIISIGMAVDANVLVFERMREEYEAGRDSRTAAEVGFARAWTAIRDGNVTSILTAAVLFWAGTSLVKGFALVFGFGVIVSMLTAILVTRTFLIVLPEARKRDGTMRSLLFGSGTRK